MANLLNYKQFIGLVFFTVQGILFPCTLFSQDFAPQAGFQGSNAIYKDSSIFVAWAKKCVVRRGYINISDTTATYNGSNKASFGSAELACGMPGGTMDVVSLGDGGYAIVSFEKPVCNGEGYDFAVFENGLIPQNQPDKAFLELAFVEVSSDSVHFFRFPAVSTTPFDKQIGGFDYLDARNLHNLAGKYVANYGTPFDLDELKNVSPLLDVNNVRFVKIIDVIGTINPEFASRDVDSNIINDPFPTPFASCGFDLDAVGVIHQKNAIETNKIISIYPNPVQDFLFVRSDIEIKSIKIFDSSGKIIFSETSNSRFINISVNNYKSGLYVIVIQTNKFVYKQKFIKTN